MTPASIQQPFLAVKADTPIGLAETVFANLLVALAYAITGFAGLQLAFVGQAVTLFWPPSGIAFAVIWMGGLRLVPGVFFGAILLNLYALGDVPLALLVAIGNALPPVVATWTLRGMIHRRRDPGEFWRVLWFILTALGTTTISATIGSLAALAVTPQDVPWQAAWLVWWMGDAMGVVIVAPPLLLWRRIVRAHFTWRDLFDALAFGAAGCGIVAGLLFIRNPIWAVELCKLFTLLLSLWAGARFGLNGPAAMTFLMALGAVSATVLGVGPFARGDFYDSFASVHSYLFAEAIAGMLLAASLADLRRAVAAESQARLAAESAAEQRVRLLTMISHDVRNPLGGIMGVLQRLQRGALAPDQMRLVDLASRAGGTLTTLINDILDVARADADRIALDPAPFDPRRSLSDLVEIHRARADARGLALTLSAEALPAFVEGDRARFEQLIGNLISNAIAYTLVGGVTVQARWHGSLTVAVIDTGPGIEPGRLAGLFEAFSLSPGSSSAGLGLGLHICRRLAELMGGRIGYRPAPQGGSIFEAELPLPAVGGPTALAPTQDPPQRVLLIEDDDIAREVTAALLHSLGHQVVTASNSAEARARVSDGRFDLVLIDMQLGTESGQVLAAELAPLLPGVLMLALTADALVEGRLSRDPAGLSGVLVKPLAVPRGLAAAVAAAVQARAAA